jgi:hypothetical protein
VPKKLGARNQDGKLHKKRGLALGKATKMYDDALKIRFFN